MKSRIAMSLPSRRRTDYRPRPVLVQGCKAIVVRIKTNASIASIAEDQSFLQPILGIDVQTREIVQRATIRVPAGHTLHLIRAEQLPEGFYYITGSPELTGGKSCTCIEGLSGQDCEHQLQPISA